MVEATLTQENLGELHGRLSRCFARVEPLQQARKYVTGLMSDLPRKNCWTISEHAGDRTPDRMQRLLNDAVWDTTRMNNIFDHFATAYFDLYLKGEADKRAFLDFAPGTPWKGFKPRTAVGLTLEHQTAAK